jgi:stage V sporulation protein D (sporulation-specific penicillin-binding protein)
MKLFTIAAAIEDRQIKMTDKIYVPSKLAIRGTLIEEAHDEGAGYKTPLEILAKSLNVGAAKIGLQLGSQKLHHYLSLLEFGKRTGIGIGGESPGILWPAKSWREVDLSRISFGYSVSVTPIQLLKAVSVFGNDGVLVDPYIVDDGSKHQKHHARVFSPHTVKVMKEAMINIVENGTGEQTKIKGFSVGGKTGTARRFVQEANGYVLGSYNTSFLGIFPVKEPRFAMIVIVTNPRTTIYASQTAVPCFKDIAQQMLRYYRIKPDALPTQDAKVRT